MGPYMKVISREGRRVSPTRVELEIVTVPFPCVAMPLRVERPGWDGPAPPLSSTVVIDAVDTRNMSTNL
jgi:hypothetical protein